MSSQHLALLSEPLRVRLLSLLSREELGVGELTRIVQLPQSTVSRHLKALRVAGWIERRAEGTAGLFRMEPDDLPPVALQLWKVVGADFRGSPQHAEDDSRLATVLQDRRMDTRTFFGRMHGVWDSLRRELFGDDFVLPTLLALLPEQCTVTDLGCGTGETVAQLAPHIDRVVGVDASDAMIDAARARTRDLPNVDLRLGGIEALPMADAEVDAALCMLVLHHVEDPAAAMREMRRVVRPTGRVVLLDMVAHTRREYRHTMGHRHLGFSEETVRALADQAGLAIRRLDQLPTASEAQGPPLFLAVLAPI